MLLALLSDAFCLVVDLAIAGGRSCSRASLTGCIALAHNRTRAGLGGEVG